MKRTTFFISLFIVLIIGGIWSYSQYNTGAGARAGISDITGNVISVQEGEKISIDKETAHFEFEGYNPVRSHVGTFNNFNGFLVRDQDNLLGFQGTIDPSSVSTGIDKLDTRLKSDDFFDIEKFPEISFQTTNIDLQNNQVTGNLNFRGIEKEITFPIKVENNRLSTEFFLDTEPFNFKYTAVNPEVRIAFEFDI